MCAHHVGGGCPGVGVGAQVDAGVHQAARGRLGLVGERPVLLDEAGPHAAAARAPIQPAQTETLMDEGASFRSWGVGLDNWHLGLTGCMILDVAGPHAAAAPVSLCRQWVSQVSGMESGVKQTWIEPCALMNSAPRWAGLHCSCWLLVRDGGE